MTKRKKRMKINSIRLYRVSAFYKSDQLEGLGIVLEKVSQDLEKMLVNLMEKYEAEWKSAKNEQRHEIVEHYFGQLNHFAKMRAEGKENDRTLQESIICILNIIFLEQHGFLKSDNFNGGQLLYGAS